MGLWAAPRKTRDCASEALAPLKLALSLGSPCTEQEKGEEEEQKQEKKLEEEEEEKSSLKPVTGRPVCGLSAVTTSGRCGWGHHCQSQGTHAAA